MIHLPGFQQSSHLLHLTQRKATWSGHLEVHEHLVPDGTLNDHHRLEDKADPALQHEFAAHFGPAPLGTTAVHCNWWYEGLLRGQETCRKNC